MRLPLLPEQCKRLAELGVQCIGRVAHDWKSAALCGPVFCKGGDDDMPKRLDRAQNIGDVGSSALLGGEEVENCSIVPDVEGMLGQLNVRDVSDHPADVLGPDA